MFQLRFLLSASVMMILGFQQMTLVSSHKCFVCLPPQRVPTDPGLTDILELEKMFGSSNLDSIPKCADYNRSIKEDFIRDCPADSTGCLTKFSAGHLMRTCATISSDECKEEKSGQTFCYCKKDLCNTPDRKLSDAAFGMAASHQPRREGVARALQSSSPLNSATSDDEDLAKSGSKNKNDQTSEGSGDADSEGDDNYYDATYFGEYDDDDEDSDTKTDDTDADALPPGDVDMTEPPPFIVEEEIKNWNSKFGDGSDKKSVDKNVDKKENADNDIDFEESDDNKQRKTETGNVHSPTDRKHIINRATVLGSNTALSILMSQLSFILLAKKLLL